MDYINSIANMTKKPKKKMAELDPAKKYKITGLKKVETKHGDTVIATLNDEFIIFLPKRLTEALKDETGYNILLDFIRKDNLSLEYYGGKWNNFRFVEHNVSEESMTQDN